MGTINQNHQVNNPRANPDTHKNNARPDVRNNLDSRKNEEQEFKGGRCYPQKERDQRRKIKEQRITGLQQFKLHRTKSW